MAKKNYNSSKFPIFLDTGKCHRCRVKICKKYTKVIYKEVVECMHCGHIWVLRSAEQMLLL